MIGGVGGFMGSLPGFADSGDMFSSTGAVTQGGLTMGRSIPGWAAWAAVAAVVVVGVTMLRKG